MDDSNNISSEKKNSIKIILIGNSGVGKTCISQRYIKGNKDIDLNPNSTVGASYFQKFIEIDGKSISVDIWDTAGQEKYRSMGKMFYKEAHIVLFIYDITNKESFKELQEIWYNEITENGEKNVVFVVVGNKSDLFLNEQVKEEDAREWAEQIGALYSLVSAKTGDCINALFENAVKKYLSPNFNSEIKKEKKQKENIKRLSESNNNNIQKKKKKHC